MESRKMVLKNSLTGQQWRNRHRKQTYGHGERGGEGEMYLERVTWKLTLPYVKQIANGNLLYDSGSSETLYQSKGGGMGWEMGGRQKGRDIMYTDG